MHSYYDMPERYYGETIEGYPHGKGTKIYPQFFEYEGQWEYGRKHGRGILRSPVMELDLEYSCGIPVKVHRASYDLSPKSYTYVFLKLVQLVNEGKYYKEIFDFEHKCYYIYNKKLGVFAFDGKVFDKELNNFTKYSSDSIEYIGESQDNKIPYGFCEINTKYFTYIGYTKHLILEGQGEKVYLNGTAYKGNFHNNYLSGEGEISNKIIRIKGNFVNNKPSGRVHIRYLDQDFRATVTFENNIFKVLVDAADIKYLENIKNELKILLSSLEDIYLKYDNGYVNQKKGFTLRPWLSIPKTLNDIVKIDYYGTRGWLNIEKKMCESSNKIVQTIYEPNGIYYGEVINGLKHGKGKYIFNNKEIYKGEWKNGKLEGYGIYYYANGSCYLGEFVNGQRHGVGKLKVNSKLKYVGQWENNIISGKGNLKSSENLISGLFADGVPKLNLLILKN